MNEYKKMSSEVETVVKKVKKLPTTIVKAVEEEEVKEERKKDVEWSTEDEQEYRKLYLNLFTKKRSKIDLSLSGLHYIRLQLQGSQYEDIEIDELYQIVKIFKTTEELDNFLMEIWNFDK
jgi:hypothetical protein